MNTRLLIACMALVCSTTTSVMAGELVWLGATRGTSTRSLQTAARRYVRPGSPSIWLVGVAHLGDAAYFEALDDLLEKSDVIIFEAVLPEGAVAPSGLNDVDRTTSTTASLKVLANAAANFETPPTDMHIMAETVVDQNRVMANIVRTLGQDAWGNTVEIVKTPQGTVFRSLGADGRIGGDGSAADIDVPMPDTPPGAGTNLQRELADVLRMRFQLNELPYERPNWVPGDMNAEEVSRRLSGGEDTVDLGGILTGSSLTGKVAVGLIRMLPGIDAVSGGRAIDGFRLMMIELLSNPDLVKQGVAMYGERLEQVILHDRNDVAIEVTKAQLARMAPDASIAVLYGAAHMSGLDAGFCDAGWEPVETRWLPAITIDLAASNLDAEDIAAMEQMSEMASSMFGGQ